MESPRLIHKLTQRKVDTAAPGSYSDGGGLLLKVAKTGGKKWSLTYTLFGKKHEMGLGGITYVSLSEARDRAYKYRKMSKNDIDPIEFRNRERMKAKEAALAAEKTPVSIPTFTICAEKYISAHRKGWKSEKHAQQWENTLKTYVYPTIGLKTVDTIDTGDIEDILKPIWYDKTETAKRIQMRMENILDYAATQNHRDKANPARWRGHLDVLLPKPSSVRKTIHLPAMPYTEAPTFMAQLSKNRSISAMALQFLCLTVCRTSEVLGTQWYEVDLKNATWTIPEERMKASRAHRVPLSDAALNILKALPRIEGNAYLFPGSLPSQPLSNMALLQLMRRMGYRANTDQGAYVPHGFRSSFRDWASEASPFPHQVAEMALAHTIPNKVEAAYRRGDLFEKRREMMQVWADYLLTTPDKRS